MSYLTQARIEGDPNLARRIFACAAFESIPEPMYWVQEHMWQLSATDGWAKAYADSTAADPGADEAAITDAMIRDAVQAIRTAETPPAE